MRALFHSVAPSLAMVALFASVAQAASPTVGQEAPDFDTVAWVLNAPREASVHALRGEVIIVEKWGVKCPPCLALIPHIQKLQDEFGGKGLNIFAFEAQNHQPDEIRSTVQSRGGKTYPVSSGAANNYQTNGGIPHAWIVGVDGKVIWEGNPGDGGFDKKLRDEMLKVRFPGMGRNEFDPALNKALGQYVKNDWAGARKEAKKVQDASKSSDAAKADAQYVTERLALLGERRTAEARQAETDGRWLEAQQAWTFLQGAFGKEAEGEAAKARLEEMKKDENVKKELDAARRLEALVASLANKPAAEKKAALEAFAKSDKVAGTAAARRAGELAQ